MIEFYITAEQKEKLEFVFQAKVSYNYQPQPCIAKGDIAPVIIQGQPKQIVPMKFGMPPKAASEEMQIINARAEGKKNRENKTNKIFPKEIKNNRFFASPLRYQRYIIPVSALIFQTGNKYDYHPYLCHFKNKKKRPFALAAIWDKWMNSNNGEATTGFCLVTVAATKLISDLEQKRAPIILNENQIVSWLSNNTSLNEITGMLEPALEADEEMNAYPVDKRLIQVFDPEIEWLQPIGNSIYEVEKVYRYR